MKASWKYLLKIINNVEIEYCNNERLNKKIENDTKESVADIIYLMADDSQCPHKNIKISICINDPLDNFTKGNIFCNDCSKTIIRFNGNVSNPIIECSTH